MSDSTRLVGSMRGGRASIWLAVCLALTVVSAAAAVGPVNASCTAQVAAKPVVTLSPDTIGLGDTFEFFVAVHVPAGSVVYFPDTVATSFALENFRPVVWSAESEGDGASLTLRYPLIAFRIGLAPLPELDVYIGPAAGVGGERLPGGSVVGSWRDMETGPVARTALSRAALPSRNVWVGPVIMPEDFTDPLEPRSPADVVGPGWNRLAVASILVLLVLLLAVARSIALSVHPDLGSDEPLAGARLSDSFSVRWQKALDELDAILALGLHTEGRTDEFYKRSSGVVRSFVEGLDTEWHPSLTSTELMSRLETWTNGSSPELYASLHSAEVVKFGRLRPGASTAEDHWRDLRNWVHASRSVEPHCRATSTEP